VKAEEAGELLHERVAFLIKYSSNKTFPVMQDAKAENLQSDDG
jgi:hypothetical protein